MQRLWNVGARTQSNKTQSYSIVPARHRPAQEISRRTCLGRPGHTWVAREGMNSVKPFKITNGVLPQADGANALGTGQQLRQVRQTYQNQKAILFILLDADCNAAIGHILFRTGLKSEGYILQNCDLSTMRTVHACTFLGIQCPNHLSCRPSPASYAGTWLDLNLWVRKGASCTHNCSPTSYRALQKRRRFTTRSLSIFLGLTWRRDNWLPSGTMWSKLAFACWLWTCAINAYGQTGHSWTG